MCIRDRMFVYRGFTIVFIVVYSCFVVTGLFKVCLQFVYSFVYAHIEVVVAFLVVNFFGFWVITRYHTMRF